MRYRSGIFAMVATCCWQNTMEKQIADLTAFRYNTVRPIYYLHEEATSARHSLSQDIVRKDEQKYDQKQ